MEYVSQLNLKNFEVLKKKTFTKVGKEDDNFYQKSFVVIKDLNTGHIFKGTATISKEDKDYCSNLVGYQIAERRAYIAYLKFTLFRLKCYVKWLDKIYQNFNSFQSNKDARNMKHNIIDAKAGIKQIQKLIKDNYKRLDLMIEDAWKVKKKVQERIGQNT